MTGPVLPKGPARPGPWTLWPAPRQRDPGGMFVRHFAELPLPAAEVERALLDHPPGRLAEILSQTGGAATMPT